MATALAQVPARVQTEDASYVRDTHSKALLNTNLGALQRHRRQVADSKKVVSLEAQLAAVHAQVAEILSRLK